MLIVVLVALAVLAAWCAAAVGLAMLAGGVIHARDHHDLPVTARSGPLSFR